MAIVFDKGYGPAISQAFKGMYGSMDRMDALKRQEAADRWRIEQQGQQRAGWDRREQDWRYQDKLKGRAEAEFEQGEIDRLRQREMLNLDKFAGIDPSTIAGGIAGQDVTIGQGAYLGQPGIDPSYSGIDEDSEEVGSALRALSPEEKMAFQAYSKATTGTDQTVFLNRQMETEAKIKQAEHLAIMRAAQEEDTAINAQLKQQSIADALAQQEQGDENARIALGLASGIPDTDPVGIGMDDHDMGPQGQTQTVRNVGWGDVDRVYGAENWADINARLRAMVGQTEATKRLASAGLGGPGAAGPIAQGISDAERAGIIATQSGRPLEVDGINYSGAPGVTATDIPSVTPGNPNVFSQSGNVTPTTPQQILEHEARTNDLRLDELRGRIGRTQAEQQVLDLEALEVSNAAANERMAGRDSAIVSGIQDQRARENRLAGEIARTDEFNRNETALSNQMFKEAIGLSGDVRELAEVLKDDSLIKLFKIDEANVERLEDESDDDFKARVTEMNDALRTNNREKLTTLMGNLAEQTRHLVSGMEPGIKGRSPFVDVLSPGDREGLIEKARQGINAIKIKLYNSPSIKLGNNEISQMLRAYTELMTGNWKVNEFMAELDAWDIYDKEATALDEQAAKISHDEAKRPDYLGNVAGGMADRAQGARQRIAADFSTPEQEATMIPMNWRDSRERTGDPGAISGAMEQVENTGEVNSFRNVNPTLRERLGNMRVSLGF